MKKEYKANWKKVIITATIYIGVGIFLFVFILYKLNLLTEYYGTLIFSFTICGVLSLFTLRSVWPYNSYTADLIIDENGITMAKRGRKHVLKWEHITQISYRGFDFPFLRYFNDDSITLKAGMDLSVVVNWWKKDYQDAWYLIVTEFKRRNPNLYIDERLLKRLGMDGIR